MVSPKDVFPLGNQEQLPEVMAHLPVMSAGGWDESICAQEGVKPTGRGDAVRGPCSAAVGFWGQSKRNHHPIRGQKKKYQQRVLKE